MSPTEKDKYHVISLIYEILKNDTNELTKQIHRHRKQTYGYWKGSGEG